MLMMMRKRTSSRVKKGPIYALSTGLKTHNITREDKAGTRKRLFRRARNGGIVDASMIVFSFWLSIGFSSHLITEFMQSRVPAMMVSIFSNNIPVNIRPTLKVFSFRKDASPPSSTRAPPCLGFERRCRSKFFFLRSSTKSLSWIV
ncbi:hypothetical protein TWF481_008139 [Arthrobotrys musiformis]|uniref:Uncharacterized protein n=1 Tax=Arthrobotrys musiformis TaxID=47236 RepID=A0AAV9W691_9PEZI